MPRPIKKTQVEVVLYCDGAKVNSVVCDRGETRLAQDELRRKHERRISESIEYSFGMIHNCISQNWKVPDETVKIIVCHYECKVSISTLAKWFAISPQRILLLFSYYYNSAEYQKGQAIRGNYLKNR